MLRDVRVELVNTPMGDVAEEYLRMFEQHLDDAIGNLETIKAGASDEY